MSEPNPAQMRQIANWYALCQNCGIEHYPRVTPSGITYTSADNGHTYRPRSGRVADTLRADAQAIEHRETP